MSATHNMITDIAARFRAAAVAERVFGDLFGPITFRNKHELRAGERGSKRLKLSTGKIADFEAGTANDPLGLLADRDGISPEAAARRYAPVYLGGHVEAALPRKATVQPSATVPESNTSEYALKVWCGETRPLPGSLGAAYFSDHRGLDITRLGDLSHAVRYHWRWRAVVSLMSDPVTGRPTGIHRTFLNPDGSKRDRKMLGRAGVIRLSPDDTVTTGLGLVEGVEDGLAVLLSGWSPVWAAASAGAIARFPVLPGVECLTIFSDPDDAGQTAAATCAARWRDAGHEVVISNA